jgi:hypothetical protein
MDYEELLETYYIKNGKVYKCIGLIINPAVILEDIETKKQEVHVIGSINYKEFTHFIKE